MVKQFWVNLPVKDLKKSKEFFDKIGFETNTRPDNPVMVSVFVGEHKVPVMLVDESVFSGFSAAKNSDAHGAAEVMFSIDAESREEVDEIARKAEAAGGTVFGKPGEIQGWMYGCGFADLDGHRWNALYMDMSKMPE